MPEAVSYRYARALADAVLDPRSGMTAEKAKSELRAFDDLVSSSAELQNALLSPAVAPARKRAVIARFASELPLQKIVRNFLYVLVDRRRIGLLHDIQAAFEAEIDERSGIVRAQVTSAAALAEPERAQVQATLSHLTGKQVRIGVFDRHRVDRRRGGEDRVDDLRRKRARATRTIAREIVIAVILPARGRRGKTKDS